jgi:HK97 family phage major capsid protein/HK97 family phage prohead protease
MRYVEKSAPPPGGEPDEFVMSDDTIDRMGDVIDPGGWQLSSIKTAPPVLFNHNKDEIVGRWENIRISGNQLIGRIIWADFKNWPKGQYIRDLVRGGFLRTVSVGFRPLARQPLTKDANKDFGPFRFTKSEVLECSLVSVPANPNAIALAKSLHLSDEIVTEVFGESARSFVASNGKPAIATPVRKSTPMSNAETVSRKIQTAQQTLNVLLANYEELVGKTELTEDETKRYRDELPRQIDDARAELASHQHAERTLFGNGGGNGSNIPPLPRVIENEPIMAPAIVKSKEPVVSEASRLPTIIPRKKLEASDHQIRALAAWTKSQAAHDPDIGRTLRDMYKGGQASEVTDMVLRAAVNPANTTVATWAAELIQTDVQPFLDRLIADSIYLPLAGMGVRYTFGNAGVLKIPVRANTPTLAGNWVGEGAPKPVKRASFTTVTLSPTKLSVISTFTEEMALYSAQSIEQIIRQAMSDDTQMALDAYLIDNVAASAGVRPAGLLNGVTPITASVATPPSAAMVADLKALVGAIIAAGGGRNIAIIINPAQALSMGTVTTTSGDFLFTNAAEAGAKFNARVIVSASCPAGKVIAVDAADFATAQGDAPRFAVSTDATLHEEDTTPLALGTTGTPNVVAAPMRSLFQTDAVAVRMSMFVTWGMRRTGMVQTIAAVTW